MLRDAVELSYRRELEEITSALCASQSVLVECDKLLVPHLARALRGELRSRDNAPRMVVVDHREDGGEGAVLATARAFRKAIDELIHVVRDEDTEDMVVVVPNFDVLVSSDLSGTHLDMTAREIMAVIYENPDLRVLAFKDPNLSVPKVLQEFFSRRIEVLGVDRSDLARLITRQEARRLSSEGFESYRLYKYVSGLNVVKLRQVLSGLASAEFDDDEPERVLAVLRRATLTSADAELPNVSMEQIGGYEGVKGLIRSNILDVLARIEERSSGLSEPQLRRLERLVPRNVLFTGPPGTGKTLLAKALATVLDATVTVVSGPELKSKWVGESEERIRKIFAKARRSAPSLIIFDEIDSFAGRRGGGAGHGNADPAGGRGSSSDHSMLNQLLTEMEGFRSQELVFVVATTNFASSLDDALRSRFRYEIEVPYPGRADRRDILAIYDREYELDLSEAVTRAIVDETEAWIDQNTWARFSGREIEGLAGALGRVLLLAEAGGESAEVTVPMAVAAVRERIRSPYRGVTFDDIGGYDDIKEKLQTEILSMLRIAKEAAASGDEARLEAATDMVPKGVIFEGPPGTGKTLFARALAHGLGATVSIISGPELKSMWHGETERKVREVFAEARRNAPSVIVFDEIDSIAGARATSEAGVSRSVVNQLLTEMDGMSARELVFVVATTNFAEALDNALRRPGRFEYVINVGYPDGAARRAIFDLYDARYELGLDELAREHLVYRTEGWVDPSNGIRYSGDHLEAICRAIKRRRLLEPDWSDDTDSLDKVVSQRTRAPIQLADEEERVVATHEAGHAIVALKVPGCPPIRRISIASEYDGSLGYVMHGEAKRKYVEDEAQLRAQIVCLMGGRAAERLCFGHIASGSANDIERATVIATHLVATFGMDPEIGPRTVMHPLTQGTRARGASSPALLEAVEKRVGSMLTEAEQQAIAVVTAHRAELEALRDALLTRKSIADLSEERLAELMAAKGA